MLHEELHEEIAVAEPVRASDYELERNKPMPNIIHGAIQATITFLLRECYGNKFMFINELSLDAKPPSTPAGQTHQNL